jgi:hypothetical protein
VRCQYQESLPAPWIRTYVAAPAMRRRSYAATAAVFRLTRNQDGT